MAPPTATATPPAVRASSAPSTKPAQWAARQAASAAKQASLTQSESRDALCTSRGWSSASRPGPGPAEVRCSGAHAALRSGRRAPRRRPVQPDTVNAARPPRGGWGETSQDEPPATRSRPLGGPEGSAVTHTSAPAAAGAGQGGPGSPGFDQRQADVRGGPGGEVGGQLGGAPVARQQEAATARAREVEADRARRAHGLVERLLARGPRGVQHDQRRRVGVGHEPALHQLARPGHRRPVDARGGRALAIGPQARPARAPRRGRGAGTPAPWCSPPGRALRPAPPPPAASTGSMRGSTISSSPPSPCTSRT